jgi:hypothetical protein
MPCSRARTLFTLSVQQPPWAGAHEDLLLRSLAARDVVDDISHGSSVRQVGAALDVAIRDPMTGKRVINERMARRRWLCRKQ